MTNLTNRGAAVDVNLAHFAGAQTQRCIRAFASGELCRSTGRTGHLAALARLHFDVMNRGTHRDRAQRQRIARLDRRIFAADDLAAGTQAFGREDIAALAVGVFDQRDVRTAVRVVLEALYSTRNTVLVAAKIDNAVTLLVTAALVTNRDPTLVVATALRRFFVEQGRMRLALVQAVGLHLNDETSSRRCRFCFMQRHDPDPYSPPKNSSRELPSASLT